MIHKSRKLSINSRVKIRRKITTISEITINIAETTAF